jgi:hypothetical protein
MGRDVHVVPSDQPRADHQLDARALAEVNLHPGTTGLIRCPRENGTRERYADRKTVGVLWNCGLCGTSFELEDVLIADGTPKCPVNGESGWESVFPPL